MQQPQVNIVSVSKYHRPTKRAPDVWDSAAFLGIFLVLSFFSPKHCPRPPTQVTQTVRWTLRA